MSDIDFLGKGWTFPLQVNADGAFVYTEGRAHVEQSLRLVLMTVIGDRVMRPGFGSEAPNLVFAPGSVQYLRLLETSVRKAVRDWEPRVELEDVIAASDPQRENAVTVEINYVIRGSNTRRNLVFPFYLGIEDSAP
jgi:phage baseplate assembly protein W